QVADPSRASSGHVLWTYAHVPHGYKEKQPGEVASLIEAQIERFAPGFKDTIRARHSTSPQQLEAWNPNIIGGDIAGGPMAGLRVLFRPGATPNPYRIGPHALLASGATPPGPGPHGMAAPHPPYSRLTHKSVPTRPQANGSRPPRTMLRPKGKHVTGLILILAIASRIPTMVTAWPAAVTTWLIASQRPATRNQMRLPMAEKLPVPRVGWTTLRPNGHKA